MSLEHANPVIVMMILLPFVIIWMLIVCGVLNYWYKHRSEEA